jgi:hypothetical protein
MLQIAGGIVLAILFLAILPVLIRLAFWLLGVGIVLGVVGVIAFQFDHDAGGAVGAALIFGLGWVAWATFRNETRERRAREAALAIEKEAPAKLPSS